MIDLHTARNAVKEKTNEVFAEAVHRRFVIRLRKDDSRNQGFVEASFVEGTGNYGGDDRAVRHAILRGLRERKKRRTCLTQKGSMAPSMMETEPNTR